MGKLEVQGERAMKDNRIFSGSVSIRIGTRRVKIELSPAEIHGGDTGLYRARIDRRWHNDPDGGLLLLDKKGLARLIADVAFEDMPEYPENPPDIPLHSRVSVIVWDGFDSFGEQTFTSTPPIRGFDGQFYVGVRTFAKGFVFVPVKDVIRRNKNGSK